MLLANGNQDLANLTDQNTTDRPGDPNSKGTNGHHDRPSSTAANQSPPR
jgi:hypothetical protein